MDQEFENYMLLVKNYNDQLKHRGTDWLGPEDLGDDMDIVAEKRPPSCISKRMDIRPQNAKFPRSQKSV